MGSTDGYMAGWELQLPAHLSFPGVPLCRSLAQEKSNLKMCGTIATECISPLHHHEVKKKLTIPSQG
jgi:hypothetical protein